MATSVSMNRKPLIIIVALVLGCVVFYRWLWSSSPGTRISIKDSSGSAVSDIGNSFDHKIVDITKLPKVPASSDKEISAVNVQNSPITVNIKRKLLNIHSLQTVPKSAAKLTVLLLHGLGDGAHNWADVHTLQLLSLWGYKAVAIDLPGHGDSQKAELGDVSPEEFMVELVKTMGSKPVIVAPSMAGTFAFPYLFKQPSLSTQRAVAFVPVSPVQSEMYAKNYTKSELPTLVLYGAEDLRLGVYSKERLQALPKSHIAPILGAGHASFKEKPELFHRALYHFLKFLKK